jgi:hypothetical protein
MVTTFRAVTEDWPPMLHVAVTVYVPAGHQGWAPESLPHWAMKAGLELVAVPRPSDP